MATTRGISPIDTRGIAPRAVQGSSPSPIAPSCVPTDAHSLPSLRSGAALRIVAPSGFSRVLAALLDRRQAERAPRHAARQQAVGDERDAWGTHEEEGVIVMQSFFCHCSASTVSGLYKGAHTS